MQLLTVIMQCTQILVKALGTGFGSFIDNNLLMLFISTNQKGSRVNTEHSEAENIIKHQTSAV